MNSIVETRVPFIEMCNKYEPKSYRPSGCESTSSVKVTLLRWRRLSSPPTSTTQISTRVGLLNSAQSASGCPPSNTGLFWESYVETSPVSASTISIWRSLSLINPSSGGSENVHRSTASCGTQPASNMKKTARCTHRQDIRRSHIFILHDQCLQAHSYHCEKRHCDEPPQWRQIHCLDDHPCTDHRRKEYERSIKRRTHN